MFCRYCGKKMVLIKHLKKADTYKRSCSCPKVRSGRPETIRENSRRRMNQINSATRQSASNRCSPYSDHDIEFLKNNYFTMTYTEIAYKLGRSRNSIAVKILRLRESGVIPSL